MAGQARTKTSAGIATLRSTTTQPRVCIKPALYIVSILLFKARCFLSPSLSRFTIMTCPSDNTQAVDQSSFWGEGSIYWDAHRVGWAIAGGSALLVRATSLSGPRNFRLRGRRL